MRKITPYRVLLLGCSYTVGVGVEDYQTYAWLLNDRYRDISFDNYAGGGYSTYQCYLLEKRLLDRYKDRHYELVLYAAIEPHLYRNVACTSWRDPYPEDSGENSTEGKLYPTLFSNPETWYYPTAYLKSDGTLGENPALTHWPGDQTLSLISTTKHLCSYLKSRYALQSYSMEELSKIYSLILDKMEICAHEHGTEFAALCLENEHLIDPNSVTRCPCSYVTDGREGEVDEAKFHVYGDMKYHPSQLVHRNWAKHIATWMDNYIAKTKPKELENSPDLERALAGK